VGLKAAALAGVDLVVGWDIEQREDVVAWNEWLKRASVLDPPTHMRPRPHLHYTSGTTGKPKAAETPPVYFGAAKTIDGFVAEMRARAALSPAGPSLIVSPLYHTGPLTQVRSFVGGVSVVTMAAFDPEAVLATIAAEKIANVLMVPTHFQRLLALPDEVRARYTIASLQRVAHTGAACSVDVKRRMIEWVGPALFEAYGATEAGTTAAISSQEWLLKPGSVGKAMAPFEAIILGEDGRELGCNEIGVLYFCDTSGRGIIYHNDPEKTRAAHASPGVFTLGEMAYVDEDGYIFITDRVSDMVVSGGVNLYPAEVEQALLLHESVADVAVIGVPNDDFGEELKALVVVKANADVTADDLDAFCRQRLAAFKCPKSYEFRADIGRNAMGKVNKRALRRPYWPSERTIGG
jgi:acyl-CoA synthetase (AMP-forming)/AMP-acid ligase II